MNENVWAYSNTGTKVHAFVDPVPGTKHLRALCHPNITRSKDSNFFPDSDVDRSPKCTRCEARREETDDLEAKEDAEAVSERVLIEEFHAEALQEDAEREAEAAGVVVGREFKPKPGSSRIPGTRVRVRRIWRGFDGDVAVAVDISEPGKPYRPGLWGTAMRLGVFIENYRPVPEPKLDAAVFPDEVVQALRTLRMGGGGYALNDAINVLDNAGIFAPIDEQTGYDIDPAPRVAWRWTANLRDTDGDHLLRTLSGSVTAATRDEVEADVLNQFKADQQFYLSDIRINKL